MQDEKQEWPKAMHPVSSHIVSQLGMICTLRVTPRLLFYFLCGLQYPFYVYHYGFILKRVRRGVGMF